MSKVHFLKDLAAQLSEALPTQFAAFKTDFEKNCRAILIQTFNQLDLVTREEFDTQTKVLARTRKKLQALEQQLQEIEKLIKQDHTSS